MALEVLGIIAIEDSKLHKIDETAHVAQADIW